MKPTNLVVFFSLTLPTREAMIPPALARSGAPAELRLTARLALDHRNSRGVAMAHPETMSALICAQSHTPHTPCIQWTDNKVAVCLPTESGALEFIVDVAGLIMLMNSAAACFRQIGAEREQREAEQADEACKHVAVR